MDSSIESKIRKIYQDKLHRDADQSGLKFFHDKIKTGIIKMENLETIIEQSDEYKKLNENLRHKIKTNDLYDKQTFIIMKKILKIDSNCIDVGAHKGHILKKIVELCPKGSHLAFEPIPEFYNNLKRDFPQVKIFDYALSNQEGESTFYFVKDAPAYSGLKQRDYDIENPKIIPIVVKTQTLDSILEKNPLRIDFIKIDVEGAEGFVIQGGMKSIKKNRPFIVFEFGKRSSGFYDITPERFFDFFSKSKLKISLLADWIDNKDSLTLDGFKKNYHDSLNYYFLAHPD
ncbi:MAG TPA: FkbM family methyltransferase [Nitrosopumilaceae archaeon]|nr:FkbM family methyltransferase [Nitrosopumilaceae archaeon]